MLAVISDIHLTDGSTSFNVKEEAFTEVLQDYILDNAVDKKGDPIVNELNIILLGDIFDLMRTEYWLKQPENERPWNGDISLINGMNSEIDIIKPHYEKALDNILNSESGKAFISALKEIKKGYPDAKIYYIIGNHDRAFNNFNSMQVNLQTALSDQYNESDIKFTNLYFDTDYSILCRHGHEYDENNFGYKLYLKMNNITSNNAISQFDKKIYCVQTIGEVITCELMAGLVFRLKQSGLNADLLNAFMDINNVRPLSDAMRWLIWYGKSFDHNNKKILMDALENSIQAVLNTSLAKKWDDVQHEFLIFNMDITDEFEKLLGLMKGKTFDKVASLVDIFSFFDKLFGSNTDDYETEAEKIFNYDNTTQYILFGHTHESKHIYFNGTPSDRIQMYLNTGTFLPFIEKTKNEKGFVYAHQMTIATFFRKDEDLRDISSVNNNFPTFKLWDGIKRKRYNYS